MSIAAEIQRIQNAKASIKKAIENKGVTVGDGTIDTYASKIDEITTGEGGGGSSEFNISKYANSMTFKNLNVFGTKDVEINLPNATDLSNFCVVSDKFEKNTNTTAETLTINCEKPILNASKFYYVSNSNYVDNKLKKITFNVDFSQCVNFSFMLSNLRALEIIDGTPLDFTSGTSMNYPFQNLTALKEIRFAPNSISKNLSIQHLSNISDETIESLIEGLADMNGETLYYEVGNQVGPSDFEYPAEERLLENVTSVSDAWMFMTDGSPVYSVTYGESMINTYAYAKGGIAQTLWLPSNVKSRLTNEQKTRITSKNWNIV